MTLEAKIKIVAVLLTSSMIVSGCIMLKFDAFMVMWCLIPLFFTLAYVLCCRKIASLVALIVASLCYKTYFVYVCIGVFSSSDAQAGLNFLVLPLSALVLTVPFWIIASIQEEQVSKYEGMEDETLPPLKSWNGFAMSGSPPKD